MGFFIRIHICFFYQDLYKNIEMNHLLTMFARLSNFCVEITIVSLINCKSDEMSQLQRVYLITTHSGKL